MRENMTTGEKPTESTHKVSNFGDRDHMINIQTQDQTQERPDTMMTIIQTSARASATPNKAMFGSE